MSTESSLHKIITTQEQADNFRTLLKAIQNPQPMIDKKQAILKILNKHSNYITDKDSAVDDFSFEDVADEIAGLFKVDDTGLQEAAEQYASDKTKDRFICTTSNIYNNAVADFKAGAEWKGKQVAIEGDGWISCDTIPNDGQHLLFFTEKWDTIFKGSYYRKDSFDRDNMFISVDGAHFELTLVTYWMPLPSKPGDQQPFKLFIDDFHPVWKMIRSDGISIGKACELISDILNKKQTP